VPGYLTRTVDPAVEPVSLADAKAHCRVDVSDDDTLISALIAGARSWVEETTGRALITQTWQLALPGFPGATGIAGVPLYSVDPLWVPDTPVGEIAAFRYALRLSRHPVQAVTSVQYRTTPGGSLVTLDPSLYDVTADLWGCVLTPAVGTMWPIALMHPQAVVVTYTAGYGASGTSVPAAITAAIKLLVGTWYEQREAVALSRFTPSEVPYTVAALLEPYRVLEAV
jgi:hypothetical protein